MAEHPISRPRRSVQLASDKAAQKPCNAYSYNVHDASENRSKVAKRDIQNFHNAGRNARQKVNLLLHPL